MDKSPIGTISPNNSEAASNNYVMPSSPITAHTYSRLVACNSIKVSIFDVRRKHYFNHAISCDTLAASTLRPQRHCSQTGNNQTQKMRFLGSNCPNFDVIISRSSPITNETSATHFCAQRDESLIGIMLVPEERFELSHLAAGDFESPASTIPPLGPARTL
jgi:hypothetical protein